MYGHLLAEWIYILWTDFPQQGIIVVDVGLSRKVADTGKAYFLTSSTRCSRDS